jgi:uncharacterized RDD family membrane protein YckC
VDQEAFTVQGMTGVDLSLQIAGPGSRSYAFIIDWHIRLVMALAWVFVGMMMQQMASGSAMWSNMAVSVPALVIYLLYHPIVELLMHGQTPGKRMAGVRVVNREGGPPGAGAILLRNAFRLVDSLPFFYVVGLVCTFVTGQRVRIGDMAAGTLLVVNDEDAGESIDRLAARGTAGSLSPNALELVEQVLERWNQIGPDRRGAIALALLQRIDANPPRPPAELSDAELRERLMVLGGGKGAQ